MRERKSYALKKYLFKLNENKMFLLDMLCGVYINLQN